MANRSLTLKRGDTTPQFRAQLLDGTTAVSLATATSARLVMSGPVDLAEDVVIEDQDEEPGWVHRDWASGDLDTVGRYRAEVEVTWGDGSVQTFPADGYIAIRVLSDLG